MSAVQDDWYKLFPGHKESYIKKARYLIDRGYVPDMSEDELAMQIWKKEKTEVDIPSK